MRRSVLRPVPSALTTESRERSDSPRTNVMRVPSGDHDGVAKSSLTESASVLAPVPSALMTPSRVPLGSRRRERDPGAVRRPGERGDVIVGQRAQLGEPAPVGGGAEDLPTVVLGCAPMNAIRPPSGAQAGPNATGSPPMTRPPVPSAATTRT